MHRIRIAEWILRQATSEDRAASTAGDLTEEAATRGGVWFWSALFRTGAALIWREVADAPARVTGAAILGLTVDVVASLLLAALSGAAFFVAAWSGHHVASNSMWWRIGLDAPPLVLSLAIGRMLARWAPDRELGACLAYAILGTIFSFTLMFFSTGGLGTAALLSGFLTDALERTPALAGAIWGRRRRRAAH